MCANSESSIIGKLILILFLTFMNAFFAASEMSIVSVYKYRLTAKAEE